MVNFCNNQNKIAINKSLQQHTFVNIECVGLQSVYTFKFKTKQGIAAVK